MKHILSLLAIALATLTASAQVRVPGTLTNGGNAYPVSPVGMIAGAPQIVPNMTALSNTPAWLRADGQMFHVLSPESDYRLVGGTANENFAAVALDSMASGTSASYLRGRDDSLTNLLTLRWPTTLASNFNLILPDRLESGKYLTGTNYQGTNLWMFWVDPPDGTYPLTNATRLIFWGNSLMSGVYAEDPARSIPFFVTNLYLQRHVAFMTNAGLAQRTAQNMSLAVTNEMAQFATNNTYPRTIVVWAPAFNDNAYGSNVVDTIACVSNTAVYLGSIGAELWITTDHHQMGEADPNISISRQRFNDWARTNGVCRVLDWERVSPGWQGVTTDGLHWSTNMNAILARHFYQSLQGVVSQPPIQSGALYPHLSVWGSNVDYRSIGATMDIQGPAPFIYMNARGGTYEGALSFGFWNKGLLLTTREGLGNYSWPEEYVFSINRDGAIFSSNVTAAKFTAPSIALGGVTRSTWPDVGGDTNLAAPLTLLVLGDSMSAATQPHPSIQSWSQQLTNADRRFSNLVNIAVGGVGIEWANLNYTTNGYPWRPRNGTNGVAGVWIENNDINTVWTTMVANCSNLIDRLHGDGWKVAMFGLGPRGDLAASDTAEFNRVRFNLWLESEARAEYFVPVHRLFTATNSFYFWDHIHLNSNGQYRVMLAFAESIANGPRQTVRMEPASSVLSPARWNVTYTEAGTPALYVRGSDGNVGIGTAALIGALTVNGTINAIGTSSIYNAVGPNSSLAFYPSDNYATGMGLTVTGGNDLMFRCYTNGVWTERLRIGNATGNLGIGTNNPTSKLVIHGTVAVDNGGSGAPGTPATVAAWLPIAINGTNFFLPLYQ